MHIAKKRVPGLFTALDLRYIDSETRTLSFCCRNNTNFTTTAYVLWGQRSSGVVPFNRDSRDLLLKWETNVPVIMMQLWQYEKISELTHFFFTKLKQITLKNRYIFQCRVRDRKWKYYNTVSVIRFIIFVLKCVGPNLPHKIHWNCVNEMLCSNSRTLKSSVVWDFVAWQRTIVDTTTIQQKRKPFKENAGNQITERNLSFNKYGSHKEK